MNTNFYLYYIFYYAFIISFITIPGPIFISRNLYAFFIHLKLKMRFHEIKRLVLIQIHLILQTLKILVKYLKEVVGHEDL